MRVLSFALLLAVVAVVAVAQNPPAGRQPQSPRGDTSSTFQDGKKITVDYGRPYKRNRKIMGDLVPYGQIWRTGANAATAFSTDANLLVGGTRVPAGKYTLYTLPSEGIWKLIINKQTGQWGTQYDASQDLARIDLQKKALPQLVDQFTISFELRGPKATTMRLEWDDTSLSVNIDEQ